MAYYVIIRGPLGCGKTTISEKLSKLLKATHFPVDRVLDEHGLTTDHEEGYISQRSFIKANEIIASQARPILNHGQHVVFDGNFYWKSQVDDLITRLQFPHYVFTLKAPLALCIARDKARPKTHGEDAARAVYAKSTEFDYGTIIDIDRPLDDCITDMLSHLPKV